MGRRSPCRLYLNCSCERAWDIRYHSSHTFSGAIAGDLAQIFTIPVNVIATRQQIGVQDGDTDTDFVSVGKQIIKEDGITGLWRGLKPSLVLSGGTSPLLMFAAHTFQSIRLSRTARMRNSRLQLSLDTCLYWD